MRETDKNGFARSLRSNMTLAERALWYRLRRRQLNGYRFRRQVPVGPYVVDFACIESRLIVEVDGSQHLQSASDAVRDEWLRAQGYRIARYWNHDVLDRIEEVLASIVEVLRTDRPHPPSGHLPPQAGEG